MTNQEKTEIVNKLTNECKWHFENANDYYSKENEFKRREKDIVKPLGQKLHDTGGMSLMREVYQTVENECLSKFGKHCRSALEMKWNGVGDWRG